MVWPVMYEASSDARKAAIEAISDGWPTRPIGVRDRMRAFAAGSEFTEASISVMIEPGPMALTRMP